MFSSKLLNYQRITVFEAHFSGYSGHWPYFLMDSGVAETPSNGSWEMYGEYGVPFYREDVGCCIQDYQNRPSIFGEVKSRR